MIIEIRKSNMYLEEFIKCLLNDGEIVELTPCTYKTKPDTIMIETKGKDESYIAKLKDERFIVELEV